MQQTRTEARLRMWGQESDSPPPEWRWVQEQLSDAGTYWAISRSASYPHPRPVWGVWIPETLLLSIGSPVITRELAADSRVAVHLDSGTDVVILEGHATVVADVGSIAEFATTYNAKYDWEYSAERDGPPTRVTPANVLSWRAAGAAGRDGFPQAARWQFT